MNLQRFIEAKQSELAMLRRATDAGTLPLPLPPSVRCSFRAALMTPPQTGLPLHVIAEFKKASPSRGPIRMDADPAAVAHAYASAGASAMSVLTEEIWFYGHTADLHAAASAGLPLLRKDFLFDPLQIEQTAATPASALLLIAALTPDVALLRDLRQQAESYGMEAVVEIISMADLELARESGAEIVQVNARNLETFSTDRSRCLRFAEEILPNETWIAASAISEPEHLADAASAGYHAALVGSSLMQSPDPGEALKKLLLKS